MTCVCILLIVCLKSLDRSFILQGKSYVILVGRSGLLNCSWDLMLFIAETTMWHLIL